MPRATLKFEDREIAIGDGGATFGRVPDCTFAFPDNSNISRNHAVIRVHEGGFAIEDLGSSNGTTINGQPIEGLTPLGDGDFITLGNSVIVEFLLEETDEPATDVNAADAADEATPPSDTSARKSSTMLAVAGGALGIAVVCVIIAATVVYSNRASADCGATARFSSPPYGDTVREETELRVTVTDQSCVAAVRILLKGDEIARLTEEPYVTKIDPRNYPKLSDGQLHELKIELEDFNGNRIAQPRELALQFETREVTKPKTSTESAPSVTPPPVDDKQVTLLDVQKMTAAVVRKFSGGSFSYNLNNQEFLGEVRKRTAEYSGAGGFSTRAGQYKQTIDEVFVRDKSIDPSIPYLLAMSRSQFNNANDPTGAGLWRMAPDFAQNNAYTAACQTPDIADQTQDCGAKAAALYVEDLILKTFDGDVIFGIAAFGNTARDASIWEQSLPEKRTDFWRVITELARRELVARFFAAAIVAENPEKFGLKEDRPISSLYPPVSRRTEAPTP